MSKRGPAKFAADKSKAFREMLRRLATGPKERRPRTVLEALMWKPNSKRKVTK